jgi:predicted amidophosphoribosyltransferase
MPLAAQNGFTDCPACGADNPARANYCGTCGRRIGSSHRPPAPLTPIITTPQTQRVAIAGMFMLGAIVVLLAARLILGIVG